MKKILVFLTIIALLQSACKKKTVFFEKEKHLITTFIPIKEIMNPDFMITTNEHLIISSSRSDTVVQIYSLPELEHKKGFGKIGAGPDEFNMFPMFCDSPLRNYLYLWGYNPLTIKKIFIDAEGSSLVEKDKFLLKNYEAFNDMYIIYDSIFLYNIVDQLILKKYDLKQHIYLDEIKLKKETHAESAYYSNRGIMASNGEYLIYLYLFKKKIDIFQVGNFKLHTSIEGKYDYQKPVVGKFGDNKKYYLNIFSSKKFFYALCTNASEKNNIMEVFDYDGNPNIRYTFDISPDLYVVDEARGFIYGYSYEYEDHLLRYTL